MRAKFFPIHVDNRGTISFDLDDDVMTSLRGCTVIITDRSHLDLPKLLTAHIYNFPWSKQSDAVMHSRMTMHLTHITESFVVQTDALKSHIYYVSLANPWEDVTFSSTTGDTTCSTAIKAMVTLTDQVGDNIIKKLRRVYPDERIWNE